MRHVTPPRLAERWLRIVLPADIADAFRGDLTEEYQRIASSRRWPQLWFWWQAALVTATYLTETLSLSPRSSRSVVLGIGHDLRVGGRSLAKAPFFSLLVITTLALAIGVNTAIVSVVHAALLRPFPYTEPDRLVQVELTEPHKGVRTSESPYLTFVEWQRRAQSVQGLAAHVTFGLSLAGDHTPEPVQTTFASASLFSTLGVEPILGRVYTAAEDRPGGDIYNVVISHGLWQRRFGGATTVIGQRVLLDMEPYTVIGVMPRGFGFPFHSDAWAPAERWSYRTSPALRTHRVIARLSPGVTLEQARSEMDGISLQLERESPTVHDGVRASVVTLRDAETGTLKPYLLLLVGASGLLLVIACANVANLMLVRGLGRTSEFAVRRAVGMSQWRMLRQLLAEHVLFGLLGGALGLAIAIAGVATLPTVMPIELPSWLHVRFDRTMLLTCVVLTVATTMTFGLAPGLAGHRANLDARLRGRGTAAGVGPIGEVLTSVQVALSLLLLVGAGLLMRTAVNLESVNPGFQSHGLHTAHLSLAYDKFPKEMPVRERVARQTVLFRQMQERLDRLPGVVRVTGASRAPFEAFGARSQTQVTVDGQSADQQTRNPYVERLMVDREFFRTLEIPVLQGRGFNDEDRLESLPVAIVNRSLAERLWADGRGVGRRLKFGTIGDSRPWLHVVGVVGDVKHKSLDAEADPVVYLPDSQTYPGTYTFIIRAERSVPNASAVQQVISEIDPQQAVFEIRTMDALVARTIWQRTVAAALLSAFGLFALLLAGIGIYGVVSQAVAGRTREIGVRLALGAQFSDVVWLVMRQGLVVMLGGVVVGLLAAAVLARRLSGVLFDVSALDPITMVTVVALLACVALSACYLPARRAARADLNVVLRRD